MCYGPEAEGTFKLILIFDKFFDPLNVTISKTGPEQENLFNVLTIVKTTKD